MVLVVDRRVALLDRGPVAEVPAVARDRDVVERGPGVEGAVALAQVALGVERRHRRLVDPVPEEVGVEQAVGRARARVADRAGGGVGGEGPLDAVRRRVRVGREVERGHAGHVRRRHRGAGDQRLGGVARGRGRRDVDAGGEEVEAGAEVRGRGARATGADRPRHDHPRHREHLPEGLAEIGPQVAGRRDHGDPRVHRPKDRLVEHRPRAREGDAEVDHRPPARAGIALLVRHEGLGDPVHREGGVGGVGRAVAPGDPHRVEGHPLGHAVERAGDDVGHGRAVTMAVPGPPPVVDGGEAGGRVDAAGQVDVRAPDSGVDDEDVDSGPVAGVVVEPVESRRTLVDPVETPGGRCDLGGGSQGAGGMQARSSDDEDQSGERRGEEGESGQASGRHDVPPSTSGRRWNVNMISPISGNRAIKISR